MRAHLDTPFMKPLSTTIKNLFDDKCAVILLDIVNSLNNVKQNESWQQLNGIFQPDQMTESQKR